MLLHCVTVTVVEINLKVKMFDARKRGKKSSPWCSRRYVGERHQALGLLHAGHREVGAFLMFEMHSYLLFGIRYRESGVEQ